MAKEKQLFKKPEVSSGLAQRELDKAEKQFIEFNESVQAMTLDRMNQAPKEETEQQTKLSNKELQKKDGIWLKPVRTLASKEKFNEKFRKDYEHKKEYVKFVVENKEIIGENVTPWTKAFPGQDAEFWDIPTNKPVWGPRYLAEQLSRCKYHRLTMEDRVTNADGMGSYYGQMAVDKTVSRIDCYPVRESTSVFLGAASF